jgi:hypothetical protein
VSRIVVGAALAAAAWLSLAAPVYADETKSAPAGETAGQKLDSATDKTAAEAKKVGSAVKSKTKKVLKQTGSALERGGNKIDGPAR